MDWFFQRMSIYFKQNVNRKFGVTKFFAWYFVGVTFFFTLINTSLYSQNTATVVLDWNDNGGGCLICSEDYSCFTNGEMEFMDPIPLGFLIYEVKAKAFYACGPSTFTALINTDTINQVTNTTNTCSCGDCYVDSLNILGFNKFPNYNYGGANTFKLNATAQACVAKVELTFTFVSSTPNDAGVTAIDSFDIYCQGNKSIYAKVQNFGNNVIDSLQVNWVFNGVLQPPIAYKSALDTFGGSNPSNDLVLLGTENFLLNQQYTIAAWTAMPNGMPDTVLINDTTRIVSSPSFEGNYTIGGSSPDYATFAEAITALTNSGICGPTTFFIRNGTYNEQISIGQIAGADSLNTITFQSESGDSTQVILVYAATNSSENYTLKLNGTDWVSFKGMTIEAAGPTYSRAIEITNESNHNTFESNILKSISTTSTNNRYANIYSTSSFVNEYNRFTQNSFLNGSYGLYYYGNTNNSTYISGTIISENTFENQSYTGIYLYYHNGVLVEKNKFTSNSTHSSKRAIELTSCYNNSRILANQVTQYENAYGIFLNNVNGTVALPVIIANNFIQTSGTANLHGLYIASGTYQNIYFNTIRTSNTNLQASTFYNSSGSNKTCLNNVFVNVGGGYAFYTNNTTAINTSDYNNFHVTGDYLGFWSGNRIDLADWQNASNLDLNTLAINPLFASEGDFKIGEVNLNNIGISIPVILEDIEGDLRDVNNPDIGADEWTPPAIDAGLLDIVNPTTPFKSGNQPVKVVLKNAGTDNLTTATINWQINEIAQTNYNWSGQLNSGDTDTVTIGSSNFVAGEAYNLTAWSVLPNGIQDPVATNDTIHIDSLVGGLEGIYTIGGTSPDFATFTEAVVALEAGGIIDSVIFMVRNGVYNEQITINEYIGGDSLKRVVFQSESEDSTQVTLSYSANSTNNYTLRFNGADYITFKGMTIEAANTTYGTVVDLTNESNHIHLENNVFKGIDVNTTATRLAVIYSTSTYVNEYFKFKNNRVLGGSSGLYYLANTSHVSGTEITGNEFLNQYYFGIYLDEHNTPKINENIVSTDSPYTAYNGIYSNDSNLGGEVIGNQVIGNIGNYGIYLRDMEGTITDQSIVANNFVEIGAGQANSTVYGFHLSSNSYQKVYYNTAHVTNTNPNSAAFYVINNSNLELLNNLMVNTGGGYAFYNNSSTSIVSSDYNNFYTSGSQLIFSININYNTLSDWQAFDNTKEVNSLSVNPFFLAAGNYQITQSDLNAAALKDTLVMFDIEGEPRDTAHPDIGADEFNLPMQDAGIATICPPNIPFATGRQLIQVTLKNHGTDALNNVTINWNVNNSLQTAINWSGNLLSGDTIKVALDSIDFVLGESYDLNVWTTNPNGMADLIVVNDTAKINDLTAGLGGLYTIGGVTPDFLDFTTAANTLNKGGVVGAVTFNVRDGIYEEQIVLEEVIGQDSLKQIVFQSESGDSTQVTLNYSANFSNNYTLRFNGADYVTFKGMTIEATNTTYGIVVELTNESNHIYLENNVFKGIDINTTATRLSVIYSTSTYLNEYFKFKNNQVLNGSVGLYYGAHFNHVSGTEIIGNQFTNQYYWGVYLDEHNTPKINKNTISTDSPYTSYYGIYNNDSNLGGEIIGNQVFGSLGNYGIYFRDMNGAEANKSIIANNFVQVGGTNTAYGLYSYNGSHQKIYHNSVNLTNTAVASSAFYNRSGSNKEVLNNIFANVGDGQSYYTNSSSAIIQSDHNNLYATGTNLGYFSGVNYVDLPTWITGTNRDSNSISIDPSFLSTTDLHTTNVSLDKAGIGVVEVVEDFDGDFRDPAKPDIGADEFSTAQEDASIFSIDAPSPTFSADVQPIIVTLLNNGLDTLETVTIGWEVNGVAQPIFNWTGNLLSGQKADSLNLGDFAFEIDTAYTIQAWTAMPNGLADTETFNDTATVSPLYAGLSGVYTIGGTSPDFEDFTSAVTAMKNGGIVGAVTFNVRNGTYDERIEIPEILGADSLQTITFQSEQGDSSLVILQQTTTPSDSNYVVLLDGTDWVRFQGITFENTSPNYGRLIELRNAAQNNHFYKNAFIGRDINTTSSNYILVYASSANNNLNNVFEHNYFLEGSRGLYLQAPSNNRTEGTIVKDNHFENQYYRAIELAYQNGAIITNNLITSNTNYSAFSAIYLNQVHEDVLVTKNIIKDILRGYGIVLTGGDGLANKQGLVANNFIYLGLGGTLNCYGIQVANANYQQIYHNTVHLHTTGSDSRAFMLSSNNVAVKNNIFYCSERGYAYHQTSGTDISTDYNNILTSDANFASYNGILVTDFNNWQAVSGGDANSLSIEPRFIAIDSFAIEEVDLNKAGTPLLAVTDDIEGEPRNSVTPDIGADEFMPITTNDAEITTIISPNLNTPFPEGVQPVLVELKNNGVDTLVNATIEWQANGVQQVTYNWLGNLKPGERDTLTLGNHNFTIGFGNDLLAYTQNPNNLPDNNPENDTAKVTDLHPGLEGIYTIGGVFPDFQTFTAATISLNKGGVLGPVTFNIRNGDYEEQISIKEIKGASADNRIVFQSEATDNTKVRLHFEGTNAKNYIVQLDGADYITWRYMTLEKTGSSYHTIIEMLNGTDYNIIENNIIWTSVENSSDELIYSSNSKDEHNQFLNNHLIGGGEGIYLFGQNTSQLETQTIIKGNIFEEQSQYGIYLYYQDAPNIAQNQISTNRGSSSYRAIYCRYCDNGLEITQNKITSGAGFGISLDRCDGISANRGLIVNNFVQIGGTTNVAYGIYEYASSFLNFYNNNIHITNTNTSSRAFYNYYGTNKNLLNNIFANTGGGYAIYVDGNSGIAASNFNDFYTTGATLGYWNSNTSTDIATWRAISGRDFNSVDANPLFYSDTDLHVLQVALDSAGTPVAEITIDIDGEARNSSKPDIGADEFEYLEDDIGIIALLQPADECDLTNAEQVTVLIQNFGGLPQTGFDIAFGLIGGTVITENVGGLVVQPGDTASYTFMTTIDLSNHFTFPLESYTLLAGDLNVSNDTLMTMVTNYQTPAMVANMLPSDGAINIDPPIDFSWLPSEGANSYDLYFWKDGDTQPATPIGQDLSQITFAYNNNDLIYGAVYNWQVIAKNDFCETASAIQSFTLRELPDLIAQNVQLPNAPFSGQSIEVTWTVRNQAVGATGMTNWYDYIYLSADNVYQPNVDTYLGGFVNLTALSFNQSYAQMKTVNLPDGIQGTYYIFVLTDRNNRLIEGNNDNNISAAASMNVNLTPPPDLKVTSIIKPNQAFSGTDINVQWTVLNQGTGDVESGIHSDRIYISTSAVFNQGSAIYLGQENATALDAGQSYTKIKSVTIPQSVFGDYYIHVLTDYNNQVFEHVFEDNNVETSTVMEIILTPPPDLAVNNIQAPTTANNRESITLEWEVANQGGTPTEVFFSDRIYISSHNVFNADSVTSLKTVPTNSVIINGNSINRSATIQIPSNIGGTQYFYIYTDVRDNIFEFTNEDNNISQSAAVTINNADLIVENVSLADTLHSGTEVSVQWIVKNQGLGDVISTSRTDKIYVATENIFNPQTAIEVGRTSYSGALAAGQSLNKQGTITIPNGIQGDYYVYVWTDATNVIFENNQEGNNSSQSENYVKLSPWPDLQINTITGLPNIATAGDLLTVNFEIENHGMAAVQSAGSWTDRVYISPNPTWNLADAVTLKSLDVLQPVNPGGKYNLSSTFTLPMLGNNAGAGICYIYVYADAGNKIFEHTDEGNNFKRSNPISVTAPPPVDFHVLNATNLPDTVLSGSKQNLQWMIQNQGSTTALWDYGLWYDGIYLCEDSLWHPDYEDFVKDFTKQGPVISLETYSNSQMFNIPNGISGDYYAFLVADHNGRTNNVIDSNSIWKIRPISAPNGPIKPIHIKRSPSPDLTISTMVAPNSEFAGQPIDVIWTVTNNGEGPTSGTWTDKVYLSTDFAINNSDPIIATKSQSRVIPPGGTYTDTLQAFIPINKVGNFVLILKTDANDAVFEFNGENNNTFYTFLTTSLPLPCDLVVNNLDFDTMAMVGEPFTVNYDLANQGTNPASGFMRELVYLSTDSVFDATDVKLGSPIDRRINLAPATTELFNPSARTPGVPLGDYFVIVQTDILNNIYESNDTNNITISTHKVSVSIPELSLGVLEEQTVENNVGIYYRIEIPDSLAEETMLVSLDGQTDGGVNELYLSYGAVPTRSNHDFSASRLNRDQFIVVPELQGGTYYLFAYGATTTASEQEIDLKAEIIPFQILSVEASRGGNIGNATLKIEGAKFTEDMTLELTDPSLGTIMAHKLTFINSTKVFATFNLAGATLGVYDMKAIEGMNTTALEDAFEVVAGGAGSIVGGGNGGEAGAFFCNISNVGTEHNLNRDIQHPSAVRVNRVVPITIIFGNGGSVDIPCPARWLFSMRGAPLSFDPDDFEANHQGLYLEFQEPDGPSGILRPGSVATITVYSYSSHPLLFFLRN